MDKQQKQIEEIEQFLARKILGGKAWNTRDIADGVYESITKNAVVMAREDYDYLINDCKRWEKLAVEKVDEIITTRKEMAEQIYSMAKEVVEKTKYIVDGKLYLHIDALKLIIKQLGVDLGEEK